MRKYTILSILLIELFLSGCGRSNIVWEDTKTMGRYLHRKGQLLWREEEEINSKMFSSENEFDGPKEADYIPINTDDLKSQFEEFIVSQPKEIPGSSKNTIPGIDGFKDPTNHLTAIFKNLYFNTDEYVLKSMDYYKTIEEIANYMKSRTGTYIFISGHCDERGSEAYNLALGTKRANTIRNLLVKNGVNSNNLYTISFGKEMPVDMGHNPTSWAKNRRVEFKIYKKDNK